MANVSISTGWEYFDRHTKTIESSKKMVKAGGSAPTYLLYIPFAYMTPQEKEHAQATAPLVWDNEYGWVRSLSWDWAQSDWSSRLVSASVTYESDGGAGMQLVVAGRRLQGYEGFPIILCAGYKQNGLARRFTDIQPIFQGHIYDINDQPNGRTELGCFANAKIRGSQIAGKYLDYRNLTLAEAMKDIKLRAGTFYGWRTNGGFDFVIHNPEDSESGQPGLGEFQFETTFLEIENTLTEPAGYVGFDAPWGRIIQKRPGVKNPPFLTTTFKENEYPKNGFKFTPGQRGFYSKVVVFRRQQDENQTTGQPDQDEGSGRAAGYKEIYDVYAEREVDSGDRFSPPPRRWFVVPDFNGDAEQAQLEANRLARYYQETGGEFEFEGSLADFWMFDYFGVYRTEMPMPANTTYLYGIKIPLERGYKRLLAYYVCLIDGGVEFQIDKQNFKTRCNGSAILANVAGVESPAEVSYRSTGLVPLPGTTSDGDPPPTSPPPAAYLWSNWGQEDIIFGDLGGVIFAHLP